METEVARLVTQYKELERRTHKIETISDYQQKEVQRILEAQATTKVQVEQIMSRLDKMEANIMGPIRTMADALSKLSEPGEHDKDCDKQRMWMDLFKWTLGGTIIAIVGRMLSQAI